MSAIELSTTYFPILVTRFPAVFTAAEMDTYFDLMRTIHDREEAFVHITDMTNAGAMSSASMRRKASDFMQSEAERSVRLCQGAAYIAPSALLREILTALHWVSPAGYPTATVKTYGEAYTWAKKRCLDSGLAVPTLDERLNAS